MRFQSVQLNNGKVLSGDVIGELVANIVNKFSEAGLSCDEGKIILNRVEAVLGEFSTVQEINQRVCRRRVEMNDSKEEIENLRKQVKSLKNSLMLTQISTIVFTIILGCQCLRLIQNYHYLLQQVSVCLESVNTVYSALRQFLSIL